MSGPCAICLDNFNDPRVVPCGHTFCFECAKQLVSSSKKSNVCCPKCRKKFKVKHVESLPINWEIRSEKPAKHECQNHAGESSKYWCITCSKCVCGECLLVGSHQGHQFEKREVMIAKNKQAILQQLDLIGTYKQDTMKAIELIDNATTLEENNCASALKQIKEANKILSDIQKQINNFQSTILHKHGVKKKDLQFDRTMLCDYLQNLSELEKSHQQALTSEENLQAAHPPELKKLPRSFQSISVNTYNISVQLPPPSLEMKEASVSTTIQLFVQSPSIRRTIQISCTDTIANLKKRVADAFNINSETFMLFQGEFVGKQLRDELTNLDYNLQNNTTLLLKLRREQPQQQST